MADGDDNGNDADALLLFLVQQEKGQLSKFYNLIREHNIDLSNTLAVRTSLTVFAPSNEAFNMVNKERFKLVSPSSVVILHLYFFLSPVFSFYSQLSEIYIQFSS